MSVPEVGILVILGLILGACTQNDTMPDKDRRTQSERRWEPMRHRMVKDTIEARGIIDPRVLDAMRTVPRHKFVLDSYLDMAYADRALPIGHEQTISQPFVVAWMSESLDLPRGLDRPPRVLEIGTGCGYQAAVLAAMGAEVYSIEIVEALGRDSRERLKELGYSKIHTRIGDGYQGWPEHAPFDRIILTASPPSLPPPLLEQLVDGGILVAPVGQDQQELKGWTRVGDAIESKTLGKVRFVPMTGKAQQAQSSNPNPPTGSSRD